MKEFTVPSEHLHTEIYFNEISKLKNAKNSYFDENTAQNQVVNFLTSPNEGNSDNSKRTSIEKNEFYVQTDENEKFQYFEFKSFGQLAQASKTGGFQKRRSIY